MFRFSILMFEDGMENANVLYCFGNIVHTLFWVRRSCLDHLLRGHPKQYFEKVLTALSK